MLWRFTPVTSGITTLDSDKTDGILSTAHVSLVNSYSDWPFQPECLQFLRRHLVSLRKTSKIKNQAVFAELTMVSTRMQRGDTK